MATRILGSKRLTCLVIVVVATLATALSANAQDARQPAQLSNEECVARSNAILDKFQSEDSCHMSETRVREIVVEWRTLRIDLCRSGEPSLDELMGRIGRRYRSVGCQTRTTGEKRIFRVAPGTGGYPTRDDTPLMDAAVLDSVFARAQSATPIDTNGKVFAVDGREVFKVTSGRAELAAVSQSVWQRNKVRYQPPDDQLADVVKVVAGDASSSASFQCYDLELKSLSGATLQPWTSYIENFAYTDQFGLRQGVDLCARTYLPSALAGGFRAVATSASGRTITFDVSATEAREVLLVGVAKE